MAIMTKSLFFIPVWNQIRELPNLLGEIRSSRPACDEILIVNNGSNDGSEKLIRECGFPFIDLPANRGVGHGFMVALDWAFQHGFNIFGSIAGNGKMLPSEMDRVLNPILENKADYVTGSRFLSGGDSPNLPSFRRHAIPMVNIFVQLLYGVRVTDATCGYRAMRMEIFKSAEFDWHAPWLDTYGFEYYLYGKVLKETRIRHLEVPITMRYPERGKPYSKIKPFKGWYEMLKPWVIARVDGKGFGELKLNLEQ